MADYGFDTTDLEKLIASLSRAQAPTDEDRSAARSQALQVAGLSLLGTPKGQVWGRAGQAGMNALMAKQQYLSDIPKQRAAAIESAGKAMTLQDQLEAIKERKQYESGLRGGLLQAPGAEPTAGPTSIAPSMAQAFAAPPLPASVTGVLNNPGGALPGLPPVSQLSQAPAVPPSSIEPSAPSPAATGTDPYSVLMKQAMQAQNVYQTTGNRYAQKQAEHFFGMAEKWREKMGAPQVGMVGGKPTLVRYGDYGGQQNVAGVEPTPDFATVDRGGSTDFVNKYTIPSTGQSFAKTPTFSEKTGQANQNLQERKFKFEQDQAAAGGGPGAKTTFANENTLRDEFTKQSAPFIAVRDGYRRVKSAYESAKTDTSGAADMALIFGYMKVLDPGSTVREGEYATAQQAGSIPERIRGLYNKAVGGQLLDSKVRDDFVSATENLYSKAHASQRVNEQMYKGLADRNGLRPDNVILDFKIDDPVPPRTASSQTAVVKDATTIVNRDKKKEK